MVIPNWEHPQEERPNYRTQRMEMRYVPLYDRSYREEMAEWIKNHLLWEKGEHPRQDPECKFYAEYDGEAPRSYNYRPDWKEEEATWFQVYETVSEGTPVTPPFATKEELVEYLVENGDFWDQDRRKRGNTIMPCAPWNRQQAEKFVFGVGWAPSMVMCNGVIKSGVDAICGP